MAVIDKLALNRGVGTNIVSAAANGQADDVASYSFSVPSNPSGQDLIELKAVPSTGTQSDITTCKPDLQSLALDGSTWVKVVTIDFVAVPTQFYQLVSGGAYKLTFVNNALVTANGATVNIEARVG